MRDEVDVAIIGAGAAGLAAAARLVAAPLEIVVLEARSRIGGRAHTLHPRPDLPLDAGCGWLHSADRNPLASLLSQAGFDIDRTPPHWTRQSGDQNFSAADQQAFRDAFDAFETRLANAADGNAASGEAGLSDRASDYFDSACRWNRLMNAVSAYYNGAEYDQVSVRDYAAYQDTEVNWRVRYGYGAGVASLAASLGAASHVVLDCPVRMIDHGASPIRVITGKGVLSARAVIVTVPTSLLAQEKIVFRPALPDKVRAAEALPLGLADKAFLHLARPDALPIEGHLFGRIDRTETASYHLRPFGRPYIEAYFGGRHAHALEREGEGALTAFAIDELADLLGSDVRRELSVIGETGWARDPWACGAYSHAAPGGAGARAALAEPVEDRLFFAGEAAHQSSYSTAHGAWETGVRAAEAVVANLADGGRLSRSRG